MMGDPDTQRPPVGEDAADGTTVGAWHRVSSQVAFLALLLGLATIGWDRFANIPVGSFNLKLPIVLFAVAVFAHVVANVGRRPARLDVLSRMDTLDRIGLASLVGIGFTLTLSASLAADSPAAFTQIVAIVLGAILPFVAVVLVARGRRRTAAIDAFLVGGLISATFGVYQLIAAISGLPQLIEYQALGGGLPRISSFNYEAGYFGYYMILVLAALAARWRMTGARRMRTLIATAAIYVLIVTILANTRAAYLTIPLLALLLLASQRRRMPTWRQLALIAGALIAAIMAFVLLAPSAVAFLVARGSSILDPTEPTSNAPRLQALQSALSIYADHPILGIGPGNLIVYAKDYGMSVDGGTSNSVIVNNVPVQALLDGGPLLLLLQTALLVVLVLKAFRWTRPASSALTSGLASVAVVAFVGTSYFWDLKLWAVAGLAWAVTGAVHQRPQDGREK